MHASESALTASQKHAQRSRLAGVQPRPRATWLLYPVPLLKCLSCLCPPGEGLWLLALLSGRPALVYKLRAHARLQCFGDLDVSFCQLKLRSWG